MDGQGRAMKLGLLSCNPGENLLKQLKAMNAEERKRREEPLTFLKRVGDEEAVILAVRT